MASSRGPNSYRGHEPGTEGGPAEVAFWSVVLVRGGLAVRLDVFGTEHDARAWMAGQRPAAGRR